MPRLPQDPGLWLNVNEIVPLIVEYSILSASAFPGALRRQHLLFVSLTYEGSLEACALWLDADGNGEQGNSELESIVEEGRIWTPQATFDNLGAVYLVPADSLNRVTPDQSNICHSSQSGITVAITPISSALVYGQAVDLTEEELRIALGLFDSVAVGQYDAYKAALKDVAGSNYALAADTNIYTILNLYSALYAKDPAATQQVAILFFEALALAAKRSADAGAGRRRTLSAGALDLTSLQVLQQLVADFLAAAQQQESGLQPGQLYAPDPAVLAAITDAMSALNSMVGTSPDLLGLLPSIQSAVFDLQTRILQLVSGNLTVAAFLAPATTVVGAVGESSLPPAQLAAGGAAAAEGAGTGSGDAGAIAGGVIGGVLAMAVVAGVALYVVRRRRRGGREGVGMVKSSTVWDNHAADAEPLVG
ncbi:hypothetical protein N2152v2_003011 [Parachlorella kessleri]